MENDEYPTDSDQSDDDFCPENGGTDVSEESESDVQSEDDAKDMKIKENEQQKFNKSKLTKTAVRSTRTTIASKENTENEKDTLESDDDDKGRSDALWADFLNDTNSSTKTATKNVQQNMEISDSKCKLTKPNETELETVESPKCEEKLKITEILEFAGEEVKITRELPITDNIKIGKSTTSKELPKFNRGPIKRPVIGGGGSGLGSILGQIGKKTKISVLEKSKLDWDGFKKTEGLSEELQTFNKGKDGYLERQDFLQRTDLRQFEIERNLRQNKRNN